jgi:hypothetical protein
MAAARTTQARPAEILREGGPFGADGAGAFCCSGGTRGKVRAARKAPRREER